MKMVAVLVKLLSQDASKFMQFDPNDKLEDILRYLHLLSSPPLSANHSIKGDWLRKFCRRVKSVILWIMGCILSGLGPLANGWIRKRSSASTRLGRRYKTPLPHICVILIISFFRIIYGICWDWNLWWFWYTMTNKPPNKQSIAMPHFLGGTPEFFLKGKEINSLFWSLFGINYFPFSIRIPVVAVGLFTRISRSISWRWFPKLL